VEFGGAKFVWSWEAVSACCCFAGGILAAVVGSVLTAITWLVHVEVHPWLRASGTALLIVAIPMLIMAGYCLDWLEKKQERKRNARRTGGAAK